jgi:hypothetical protein
MTMSASDQSSLKSFVVDTTGKEASKQRDRSSASSPAWRGWLSALQGAFPVYSAIHIAALVTTILSKLLLIEGNTPQSASTATLPVFTLWRSWRHWDSGFYITIGTSGYTKIEQTAFFPLYPLLIKGLTLLGIDSLIAALLLANGFGLLMLLVLYRLVSADFEQQTAQRTVLYLSIFPTAFFFIAPYTESLFLCLVLLSFYQLRCGGRYRWWLAGLFGLLASLTRPAGLLLMLPFCYEYLRQHEFSWKKMRWDMISVGLIPIGTGLFSLYCYHRFGDPLAFSHAQTLWDRKLNFPWWGILHAAHTIKNSSGLLSFITLHNLLELVPSLFILTMILLSCVGPWRFPSTHRSYVLYAGIFYLFFQLSPINWSAYPLQSQARYMLEIFPAFVFLASSGRSRIIHIHYILISAAIFFFLLLHYLVGYWVV